MSEELTNLLSYIQIILSKAMDWVTLIVEKITDTPLLLLAFVLPFVGIGISLLRRLITAK